MEEPGVSNTAIQAVPTYAAHEINHETVVKRNWGINHTEGGWPKEVDFSDAEQVARWKKRVERDEDYIKTVVRLGGLVEELVKQNTVVDVYQDYFSDMQIQPECGSPSIDIVVTFQDRLKRHVCCVGWQGDQASNITVAYAREPNDESTTGLCTWQLEQTTKPTTQYLTPHSISTLSHNSKDHYIIACGASTGSVLVYDMRRGAGPTAELSTTDNSHRGPVTGISWTQSKTNTELMTVGDDGVVTWWDTRKPGECLDTTTLVDRSNSHGIAFNASCLQYSTSAGPAKFLVGTVQGAILNGNRKSKNQNDRVSGVLEGHHSTVSSISRHPTMSKYFISAGDWSMRVWSEDLKSSILVTPYHDGYVQGAAWSNKKPSVVYAITSDGHFEAWDLLQSHGEPVHTLNMSDKNLSCMAQEDASGVSNMCAVGCTKGSVTVVRASGGLVQRNPEDEAALAALLEIETSREKSMLKRK